MTQLWKSVNSDDPPYAKRILVKDSTGYITMAKRVRPDSRELWIDDYAVVLRIVVVEWIDPVALSEIAE